MQVILISHRLAKARTLTLSARHAVLSVVLALAVLTALATALYWVTLRFAAEWNLPPVQRLLANLHRSETERAREFMQQNLNAMAVKLGEMQAQLARLDALGERLSSLTGMRPQEFRFSQTPGLGGAQATSVPAEDLSFAEFSSRLASVSREVEQRADMLGVLEAQLFERTVRMKALPTMMPLEAPFNASGFGMRIDPFTGQRAMHEGIDFIVDPGAPVVAAAGGVVQFAGYHPQYGHVVDIDHGNELVTRYAHLSKIVVQEGAVIQRGRTIGASGNTGRSTGPHLHFEVRFRGTAQNPLRFLQSADPQLASARNGSARGR